MPNIRTMSSAPILSEAPILHMLDWLTYKPKADDLARGLITDYLRKYGAVKARFTLLAEDNSLHHIGSHGFGDQYAGKVESYAEWSSRSDAVTEVTYNENFIGWNADRTLIMAAIRECGSSIGSVVIVFAEPVQDHEAVLEFATKLARVVGFYLCITYKSITHSSQPKHRDRAITPADFTPRQLKILAGMVEGKTNHDLAIDLGYSVSTIRHETMRIFQLLGVSDRREASQVAAEHSLLS